MGALKVVHYGEEAAPRAGFFSPGAGAGNTCFWCEECLVSEFIYRLSILCVLFYFFLNFWAVGYFDVA